MNIDLIFQQHYRPLCLYAIHYLNDVDAAEDIVQDAFLRLIEKMSEEEIENHKSYLYSTVHNLCIKQLQQSSALETIAAPCDIDGIISDEEAIDVSTREAQLWTAIDSLPLRCREIFLMSKRDGKKYREIARELNISEKTVEHQISKAIRVLRSKVSDFFYFLFAA
ncbi:MAG: RNA polymerase sigma-70 factor [Prevotella sp.]|nr:RNA polymerase sigma-70 factor [Prevotella sp.]